MNTATNLAMRYGDSSVRLERLPPIGFRARSEKRRDRASAYNSRPVVLLVDDLANNLLALEGLLRRDDIDIRTALSGQEALEILLEVDVAVAIIDVQMPSMDGFELALLMRGVEKTSYVPIIFVTAGSRGMVGVFAGYEIGAVDYLTKPIDEQALRGKVDVFVSLEKHRQELREMDRMREMFIAVLGHDLRDPLSGILMATGLLQGFENSPSSDDAVVQSIVRSGARMMRMIEQLLDTARLRHDGGVSLEPESNDLRSLTAQILREMQAEHRSRLDAHGDTTGTWDTGRLLQILSNLIGNALKHSPAGSPILISIDGRDAEALQLSVHNGGPPIPEESRDTLFEPFRRPGMHRPGNKGLGLGLYITRQLIQAHGGSVTFESSARSGTSFNVRLPRHAGAVTASSTNR